MRTVLAKVLVAPAAVPQAWLASFLLVSPEGHPRPAGSYVAL